MSFTIPYAKEELQISLLDITEEKINEIIQKLENSDINKMGSISKAEHNKKIAEYHGISVKDLINSPNYEKLCEQFSIEQLEQSKCLIMECGLDDKQAWAMIAMGLELM